VCANKESCLQTKVIHCLGRKKIYCKVIREFLESHNEKLEGRAEERIIEREYLTLALCAIVFALEASCLPLELFLSFLPF
jgi:hypothetical protein